MKQSGRAGSLGAAIVGALLILTANAAYLVAFPSASVAYYVQVAVHAVLGVAVCIAGLAWVWSRRPSLTSLPGLALATCAIAGGLGLAVLWFGATRPFRPLVQAHVVSSVVAMIVVVAAASRAFVTKVTLGQSARLRPAFWTAVSVVAIAGAGAVPVVMTREARLRDEYTIRNPATPPASMDHEGAGSQSPFFPSSIQTNTGGTVPADFFMSSQTCERCHKEIYDEWTSSAHRFSSFNNQWYRKSIEYMQDTIGTKPSKWCAGCHDHAMIFAGTFDTPVKEQMDRPEAHAGLGCVSCHSIIHVGSSMGQGDFVMEYPAIHGLASSDNPLLEALHDKLIDLAPRPHREAFIKPFHRDQPAEFCSSCHKVHLDVPVNGYRWIRGFNDYDNWQASGMSGQGARSFYYPPASMTCADCHMPRVPSIDPSAKDGRVRSHRFIAANTALPYVNEDATQLRLTQEFLKNSQVSVDVFALVRGGGGTANAVKASGSEPMAASTFAVGEESAGFGGGRAFTEAPTEVIAPIDGSDVVVKRGESVRIDVVVRTRNVGHFFPGGTVDGFDVWVELEAVDDKGRVLLHSGYVEDQGRGQVDPSAHVYRSLMLDEKGNPINKRNAWSARSVAYVRLVPPGAADTVHYRLAIPPDAGETITLRAKVNHRKFQWWNTQWSFAGVRDPQEPTPDVTASYDNGKWVFTGDTAGVSGKKKEIPTLPITVMAESTTTLRVGSAIQSTRMALPKEPIKRQALRGRWNDYGIGLLLQGDLKAAEQVFLKVTQIDPAYADGFVNVARARIQEGNLAEAEEPLRKALAMSPDLAKTHFFLGSVLKAQGQYEQAREHLQKAASPYPRDRVVRNQLGRVLFLERKYPEAIAEFAKVLDVDPEDLQAHYNLMLAYQGMGDETSAARERALYERFKADEASQAITGAYRQLHPHDNNERQSIHEHAYYPPVTQKAEQSLPPPMPRPAHLSTRANGTQASPRSSSRGHAEARKLTSLSVQQGGSR